MMKSWSFVLIFVWNKGNKIIILNMRINGRHYETIWYEDDQPGCIQVIDQRLLPFRFEVRTLSSGEDAFHAISDMMVRGAPLIGVTASFGIYLALYHAGKQVWRDVLAEEEKMLLSSRPTAVNLQAMLSRTVVKVKNAKSYTQAVEVALESSLEIRDEEKENCRKIGEYGVELITELYRQKNRTIDILTHCNAGWLACVDYGTATAPIYMAHDIGIPVHIWVDETRPRNQGARLTAFELGQHGVPHTVITDNAGGHLMQHDLVDMVITGSDRTTATGDVANKIGTYLKALAARDNHIPFYVALPTSSIDYTIHDGLRDIPIEERSEKEVLFMDGLEEETREIKRIRVASPGSPARNIGFDVTPAELVTGYITEKGIWEKIIGRE